jgi:hypothetical protein
VEPSLSDVTHQRTVPAAIPTIAQTAHCLLRGRQSSLPSPPLLDPWRTIKDTVHDFFSHLSVRGYTQYSALSILTASFIAC